MADGALIVSTAENVTVVEFRQTAVLDQVAIDAIGKQLYELVDQRNLRNILLDLRHVRHMSSAMVGVLLSMHKKVQAIKGKVVICNISPDLQQVFTIMNLQKILHFAKDEHEAMHQFGALG